MSRLSNAALTPGSARPVGGVLGCIVLFAGMALVLERPRTSAVAPCLALGAGLPVLGGAIGGVIWSATTACGSSLLDTHAALMIVEAGAALAVVVTSAWVLYVRDELEPWSGTRGVVLASCAALLVLTVGVGMFIVWGSDVASVNVLIASLNGPLPWAVAVALTGWLLCSPGIAVLVGGTVQLLALLWGIMGT